MHPHLALQNLYELLLYSQIPQTEHLDLLKYLASLFENNASNMWILFGTIVTQLQQNPNITTLDYTFNPSNIPLLLYEKVILIENKQPLTSIISNTMYKNSTLLIDFTWFNDRTFLNTKLNYNQLQCVLNYILGISYGFSDKYIPVSFSFLESLTKGIVLEIFHRRYSFPGKDYCISIELPKFHIISELLATDYLFKISHDNLLSILKYLVYFRNNNEYLSYLIIELFSSYTIDRDLIYYSTGNHPHYNPQKQTIKVIDMIYVEKDASYEDVITTIDDTKIYVVKSSWIESNLPFFTTSIISKIIQKSHGFPIGHIPLLGQVLSLFNNNASVDISNIIDQYILELYTIKGLSVCVMPFND